MWLQRQLKWPIFDYSLQYWIRLRFKIKQISILFYMYDRIYISCNSNTTSQWFQFVLFICAWVKANAFSYLMYCRWNSNWEPTSFLSAPSLFLILCKSDAWKDAICFHLYLITQTCREHLIFLHKMAQPNGRHLSISYFPSK